LLLLATRGAIDSSCVRWHHFGMRIVARRTLLEFAAGQAGHKDHGALVRALDDWFHETRRAKWLNSADVRQTFGHVSIISADRLVFNISGNHYRLVASVDYRYRTLWIKWIGTHAEYDAIDARTVDYDP
jgi:mRNA interferase HigB